MTGKQIGLESAYTSGNPGSDGSYGLTKRELFAAMAMQGLLANPARTAEVRTAVAFADALLEELAKEQEETEMEDE